MPKLSLEGTGRIGGKSLSPEPFGLAEDKPCGLSEFSVSSVRD
jgi:hypothetical protein